MAEKSNKTESQIKQDKSQKKKIALAVPLAIAGFGGLAAAIAIPLSLRQNQEDVIPYEAYAIEKYRPDHHPVGSADCNVIKGFDQAWLAKNDLTKYKIMEIPANVEFIDASAFYAENPEIAGEWCSIIPANIEELTFAPRPSNDDLQPLGLAENCFREAPFKIISFPKHLGGSYSFYDMNQGPSVRIEGAFKDCINVEKIDLTAIDLDAATVLMDKLDFNTFIGWKDSGVIVFSEELESAYVDGLKTTFYNCGLGTGWFGGITPRATTVAMDGDKIVTGFADYATPDLVALELYAYDNSGVLRMPAGAVGIADNAFTDWEGFESIKSVIKGISLFDWDGKCAIESIGKNAFEGCEFSINTGITIPASVTSIGEKAFAGITTLSTIEFQPIETNGTRTIGKYAFEGDINLKKPSFENSGITTISEGMFSGCRSLQESGSITIDSCIREIQTKAFDDCSIKKIILNPSSTLTVRTNAFVNNSVSTLTLSSLQDTEKLIIEEKGFPSYQQTTGEIECYTTKDELANWRWQSSISKKFANANITGWKFSYTIDNLYSLLYNVGHEEALDEYYINGFNDNLTNQEIIDLITEIEQPEDPNQIILKFPNTMVVDGVEKDVKAIGGFGLDDKEQARFPTNVVGIDFSNFDVSNRIEILPLAFYDIDSIKTIEFNNAVQTIDESAFAYCDGIKSLVLKEGIIIGDSAFEGCSNLQKIDVQNWSRDFIVNRIISGSQDYTLGKDAFKDVYPDGILQYSAEWSEELGMDIGRFFTDENGASLPTLWVGGVPVIIEPSDKHILTKAQQLNGKLIFDLTEYVQEYWINWTITLTRKDTSTQGVDLATKEFKIHTTEHVEKQLIVDLAFTNTKLNNGDHCDFDVKIAATSEWTTGYVQFFDYSLVYTGTVSPKDTEQGLNLTTDTFNSKKYFGFNVHDWEIKNAKEDLKIDFEYDPISSTTDVSAELLADDIQWNSETRVLNLPIELIKDKILEDGDKAYFKITITRILEGVEWSQEFDGSLTYNGYTIRSEQAGQITDTINNKDYAQFILKATGALGDGCNYYALIKNISVNRDAENICLSKYNDEGQPSEQLKDNTEIFLGAHKDISLKLGLALKSTAIGSQIIANDSVSFELEYGYKLLGSDTFKSIGVTEPFTLKVANSMISAVAGTEKQITMAGGNAGTYKFELTRPWIAGMNLQMDISNISGAYTPVFENGKSTYTIKPQEGVTNFDVKLLIADTSALTDESTSNFNIKFTAMQGENELWSKNVSSCSLQYLASRLTAVEKTKLVAIGAQVPYVVYEFDVANQSDNEFEVKMTKTSGNLNPTLSLKTYFAQNKKLYIRVNFEGQTIDSTSECGLSFEIKSLNLGWTQIVEGLNAASMVNFSDTGVKQMTQYNAWSGQYALNLQQALESSQHETIKISDLKITGVGDSDVDLTIGQTATSSGKKAYFDYTISSRNGNTIEAIDRNASKYWAEFSCKVQVVSGETTIYEQTLTGLKAYLGGTPIFSDYNKKYGGLSQSVSYFNATFNVPENFLTDSKYWDITVKKIDHEQISSFQTPQIVSITGNVLTLRVNFTWGSWVGLHANTQFSITFKYYANGDKTSSPSWTFTTSTMEAGTK